MEKAILGTFRFSNNNVVDRLKANPVEELSLNEKDCMKKMQDEAEPLAFKLNERQPKYAKKTEFVYDIPAKKRYGVLKTLFPFDDCPAEEAEFIDIHTGKQFKFKQAKVIRYEGRNFIVSPFFLDGGGMVVDFLPVNNAEDDSFMQVVKC